VVTVLLDERVADAVNGPGAQRGQVTLVAALGRGIRETVSQFERGFLCEGGEDDLGRLGLAEQQRVERAKDEAERLARAGPGDDEKGALQGADHLALVIVQRREVLTYGGVELKLHVTPEGSEDVIRTCTG